MTEEAIHAYHMGLEFLVKLEIVLSIEDREAVRQRFLHDAAFEHSRHRYGCESLAFQHMATICHIYNEDDTLVPTKTA